MAVARQAYGEDERIRTETAAGILGLWADIDFCGPDGAHKKQRLPGNVTEAFNLAMAMPVPPTVIVHSGYGIYPIWLFKEPWLFQNENDKQKAMEYELNWGTMLQEKGNERGWDIDSAFDLPRVLRPVGSINAKIPGCPVPVILLQADWERRYDPSDFESFVVGIHPQRQTRTDRDFDQMLAGVGEGARNETAAIVIGKLLASAGNLDDDEVVKTQYRFVSAWNSNNRPPMMEGELRTTFLSILKAEKRQRRDKPTNFDKFVAQQMTESEEKQRSQKEPPKSNGAETKLPDWHLVIVKSDPAEYLLRSPLWSHSTDIENGYIELTAKQLCSWRAVAEQALAQAQVAVDLKLKNWNSNHLRRLLDSAERRDTEPEAKRKVYIAARFLDFLCLAKVPVQPDEGMVIHETSPCPIELENGDVLVKLSSLKKKARLDNEDFTHKEITVFLSNHAVPIFQNKRRWWKFSKNHLFEMGRNTGEFAGTGSAHE
jgi:hypothetical protein